MGQDNRIEKLEAQELKILEAQLEDAQSHTYVGETDTLHCSDGELYFGYDDEQNPCDGSRPAF